MSTTLTRNSRARRWPTAASVSGSLSQICTASGRGSSATPQSRSGKRTAAGVDAQEAPGADHLGGRQAHAAQTGGSIWR